MTFFSLVYLNMNTTSVWVVAGLVAALLLFLHVREKPKPRWLSPHPRGGGGGGSCSKDTSCSAIDPVNDPDYNMRSLVKQSILLEEHLAEPNKYCQSCIVKHFLHIIALAEEAVWLAGPNVAKFPFLEGSAKFYEGAFAQWLPNRDKPNSHACKKVLATLRERRRQLIDAYFFRPPA